MVCSSDSNRAAVALICSNRRTLIGTSTVQFILATIYVALGLRLLIEGFIHTENIPGGAFIFWINSATKTQVIERAVYLTNVRDLFTVCILFQSHLPGRPFWPTVSLSGVCIWYGERTSMSACHLSL
jgi:hypothetical protein